LLNKRQMPGRAYCNIACPIVMSLSGTHLKAKARRHDGMARFVARCAISTGVHRQISAAGSSWPAPTLW
jgi:hypothetical protein